jgi:hypothetical protein
MVEEAAGVETHGRPRRALARGRSISETEDTGAPAAGRPRARALLASPMTASLRVEGWE